MPGRGRSGPRGDEVVVMEAIVARAGEVVCSCCRRAPLVGEKAILHVRKERESWACELCERSASKAGPLGEVRDRIQVRPALVGSELSPAA